MICARKHDAINLGAIVTLRFVDRAFKSTDLANVLFLGKHSLLVLQLFAEERFHLTFRPLVFANLRAPLLDCE